MKGSLVVVACALAGCGDGSDPAQPDIDATVLDAAPMGLTNHAHALFLFHARSGARDFTCTVDGDSRRCRSPFEIDLLDGMHTFTVAATGTEPVGTTWQIDTAPPDTTITSGPPALDNAAVPIITFSGSSDATSFECSLDAAPFTACTSPTALTVFDGDHMFAVRARDDAGNVDASPAQHAWLRDTRAPDTEITGGPADGAVVGGFVTFTFVATEAATFSCQVDGGAFETCTSPFAPAQQVEGPHTFAVRAIDALGQTDPSPATRSWTLDRTAPMISIVQTPSNPSNTATAVFRFSSNDASAHFACSVDGGAFAACFSPFATQPLAQTAHTFDLLATDLVGNSATASFAWSVDLSAPPVSITSGPSGVTNDATPTFEFTSEPGAVFDCRVDSGSITRCDGTFTTAPLSNGAHVFSVTAIDPASNSATATRSFSVDTVAPTISLDQVPPSQWPVNYFSFGFHANETSTFECSINAGAFVPCTSPFFATTTYGAQTFEVRGTDAAGNVASRTASWTAATTNVLTYRYDKGSTANSSALASIRSLSPDGGITLPVTGGWSHTAASSPAAHAYPNTRLPLTSSPNGAYAANVWIRPLGAGSSGTIWRNATATDGIVVSYANRQVTLEVRAAGVATTVQADAPEHEWYGVGIRTLGPDLGVELWLNGNLVGTAASVANGFTVDQARDLVVGPANGIAIDRLQMFNVTANANFMCALVLGTIANGTCTAFRPAIELAFDDGLVDTGFLHLPFTAPPGQATVAGAIGFGLRAASSPPGQVALTGLANAVLAVPDHTLAFWLRTSATSVADTVLDTSSPQCNCGITITFEPTPTPHLHFAFVTSTGIGQFFDASIASGLHSIVVTESHLNGATQTVSIAVDGAILKAITLGDGALFTADNDRLVLPSSGTLVIDEVKLWPRDLTVFPGIVCEISGGTTNQSGFCVLP